MWWIAGYCFAAWYGCGLLGAILGNNYLRRKYPIPESPWRAFDFGLALLGPLNLLGALSYIEGQEHYRDQFYAWLGFRNAKARPPDKDWALNGECGGSAVAFEVGFADRLRVLISGKVQVDVLHRMDRPPRQWDSVSDFAVLPPNFPLAK